MVAVASCLAGAWSTRASERVRLKASVVVQTEAISLDDFLPSEAAKDIHDLAAHVALGKAPLPGERRILDRDEVLSAMRAERGIEELLAVPEKLEVARWSRQVTREEIAREIESTYPLRNLYGGASLSGTDITIPAVTFVSEEAPKFRILRMEAVPNDSGTRLKIWTVSEPRTPPFWVFVDRPVDDFAALAHLKNASATLDTLQRNSKLASGVEAPVLVKAGATVEISMEGHGMKIATKGVALSPGREGGVIRVRAAVSGKVLSGTVTNSGTVEIQF